MRSWACRIAALVVLPVCCPAGGDGSAAEGAPQAAARVLRDAGSVSTWLYGSLRRHACYFADLLVGSDGQSVALVVDTGSQLKGFPCEGCSHCGRHVCPAFDPRASTTFAPVGCGNASQCPATNGKIPRCDRGRCAYEEQYSEGSRVTGFWFEDKVQLAPGPGRSEVHSPVIARLGCYDYEDSKVAGAQVSGILGLAPPAGGAPLAGLQDMFRNLSSVNPGLFSICLAADGGVLTFGGQNREHHRADDGGSVVWLRMKAERYYFVNITSLRVGAHSVAHSEEVAVSSGTTYTYFPEVVFESIVEFIIKHCGQHDCDAWREGADPICWRLGRDSQVPDKFPTIHLEFEGLDGKVEVEWPAHGGYLYHRGGEGKVWCQAFLRNAQPQTVLGASWMVHKDVIFDMARGRLGVAPADCPTNAAELCAGEDSLEGEEFDADGEQWGRMEAEPRASTELVVFAALVVAVGAFIACRASNLSANMRRHHKRDKREPHRLMPEHEQE